MLHCVGPCVWMERMGYVGVDGAWWCKRNPNQASSSAGKSNYCTPKPIFQVPLLGSWDSGNWVFLYGRVAALNSGALPELDVMVESCCLPLLFTDTGMVHDGHSLRNLSADSPPAARVTSPENRPYDRRKGPRLSNVWWLIYGLLFNCMSMRLSCPDSWF